MHTVGAQVYENDVCLTKSGFCRQNKYFIKEYAMLTSKQRSKLKSLAANLSPIGQVGKEGIGENMLASFSDCLEKRELIKINILENSDGDPQDIGRELAAKLSAECVIVIGRKAVLYRKSKRKDIEHIEI